jgi:hypothetical protein
VIIEFRHILPAYITNPSIPSWGVVNAETHHYRLAFNCTVNGYANQLCYWDTANRTYHHHFSNPGAGVISPDGQRIAQMIANALWVWNLADNSYTSQQNLRDENDNLLIPFGSVRWADADTLYYGAFPFDVLSSSHPQHELEIWRYDFDTTSNTRIVEPDTTNYRVPMALYFDARSDELLYWWRNWNYSEYVLNNLGNWSYTTSDFAYYAVYWSPRASENRAIRVKINPDNSSEYCIDTFQTMFPPTNFNRIICRQMLFGFVDWTADVDLRLMLPPPSDVEISLSYIQTENRNGMIKSDVNESNTIPYADYVRVQVNITNHTETPIQSGRIKFTKMETDQYPPTRDDINGDWHPWLNAPMNASLGWLYSDFEKRLLKTGLTILPHQTMSIPFVVRMRRSGTDDMPFEDVPFTFEGCYGVFECTGSNVQISIEDTLVFPIRIAVTRLDFNGEHRALRSAMFWAIFNETSEDKYTSGSLYDVWANYNTTANQFETIYNPLAYPNGVIGLVSESPLVPNADFHQYQVVNFLRHPPYCDPNVSPDLGHNAQPNEQPWFNNILFVTHCNYTDAELGSMQNIFNGDHRYLMAQVALGGILQAERRGAMGFNVFEYFTSNYGGSLGNSCYQLGTCLQGNPRIYDLWEATHTCTSLPYNDYAMALANGQEASVLWLDAYLMCQLNRTDNPARRFIFQQAYDNIMREINKVLLDIQYDPMRGMFSVKDANLNTPADPDNVIMTTVGDGTCNITQTQIMETYNAHIATATPNLRQYAGSNLPTILRPVLKIDRAFERNLITGQEYFLCHQHVWITKSFQGVTGDVDGIPYYYHYPR